MLRDVAFSINGARTNTGCLMLLSLEPRVLDSEPTPCGMCRTRVVAQHGPEGPQRAAGVES